MYVNKDKAKESVFSNSPMYIIFIPKRSSRNPPITTKRAFIKDPIITTKDAFNALILKTVWTIVGIK